MSICLFMYSVLASHSSSGSSLAAEASRLRSIQHNTIHPYRGVLSAGGGCSAKLSMEQNPIIDPRLPYYWPSSFARRNPLHTLNYVCAVVFVIMLACHCFVSCSFAVYASAG
jgi:hypothetical protein